MNNDNQNVIKANLLLLGICLALGSQSAVSEETPYHEQILDRLLSDADVVLPWMPGVQDIATMHNRETPIPPQCYTDSNSTHNPCYVCHQDEIPGRENTKNDRELQEAYSFSDEGLTNHWYNLFEDRSSRVASITDAEIEAWVQMDNYSDLAQRLTNAGYTGWIPDLEDLELGAAAFDAEGFALDGSWWVAFNYKPLPSTFWPTQGSTDDVMIRLPAAFYHTASGQESHDVYKANLAILEANIKGYDQISALPFDENAVGQDLNDDGFITSGVTKVVLKRGDGTVLLDHYVGEAGTGTSEEQVDLIPFVYPKGTEFLHTVRYVGVDTDGNIYNPPRMKEVRYMKRDLQSRHFQLEHWYIEENLEKEEGNLPTYINKGHDGLSSKFGWNVTGFLENREGNLRWNTYEENVFCMGCHTSIGSTIDKTFSFPRKVDGAAGWGYINLRNMPDAPNHGESLGELATYLGRVGGGTEFRSNPELESRFYHADGSVNTVAVAMLRDIYDAITPSRERALELNKAYRVIVEDQDFIYGRDATATPPPRVLSEVDNETSPTLPADRQFDWDMTMDWASTADQTCFYTGEVDFRAGDASASLTLRSTEAGDNDQVCTDGSVILGGHLALVLEDGFIPAPGDEFELVRGGSISGSFATTSLPTLPAGDWLLSIEADRVIVHVQLDSDNDGVADADDNCTLVPNGPLLPDAGGHSQRDTDNDGFGNACDADLNNNGIVTGADYVLFRQRIGSSNPDADFDGNGVVSGSDFATLRTLLGKQAGPAGILP